MFNEYHRIFLLVSRLYLNSVGLIYGGFLFFFLFFFHFSIAKGKNMKVKYKYHQTPIIKLPKKIFLQFLVGKKKIELEKTEKSKEFFATYFSEENKKRILKLKNEMKSYAIECRVQEKNLAYIISIDDEEDIFDLQNCFWRQKNELD